MIRRLLLGCGLLLAALPQSGCTRVCTFAEHVWGVEGCGQAETLNDPPRLGNYNQTRDFPEVGEPVFFRVDAVDPNGDDLSFEWDFEGDGHIDEFGSVVADGHAATSGVQHRYRAPAIAHLRVRVSDFPAFSGGVGEDTETRRFRVHTRQEYERDRPPVASFSVGPEPVLQHSEARFDASASTDPDGDQIFYSWSHLPDGLGPRLLTSPVFTQRLAEPGRDRWELTVTDDYGKSASTDRAVQVVESPEPPHLSSLEVEPRPALVNEAVTVAASASDPNNDVAFYEWDLDGLPGFELRTIEAAVSTSYAEPGDRWATVRVTDQTGLWSQAGTGFQVVRAGGPDSPNAALTVDPNPAAVGQTVSFSAAGSTGPAPETARYQWDLDADGAYETQTTEPVNYRSYASPGDYNVRVRVIHIVDGSARAGVAGQTLRVNPAPPGGEGPTARLSIDPNPALVGQTVGFDASASTDPTGDIVSYEWDLDGFPDYEVEPDARSATERSYDDPDTFTVSVRVTDGAGHSDTASRTMQVESASGGAPAMARSKPRPRPFSARLTGRTSGIAGRGARFGFTGRGRIDARLPSTPRLTSAERTFKRFLRARWRSKPLIVLARRSRRARISAPVLASRGRDRACVRVDLDLRAGALPRGTFKVLGGTGAGATLRGTGSFRFQVHEGKPAMVVGRLRAGRGRARELPRPCQRLAGG